jgi:hypothetical protein
VFVALGEGGSESTDVWSDFLGELTARGLTHRYWSSPTAPAG